MGINKFMGFYARTRKGHQAALIYGIIIIDLEGRRGNHDSYDRKCIAYTRRSCRQAQSCKIYRIAVHQSPSTRGSKGRRSLPSEAGSPRSLHQEKYHTRRRQKIKPARRLATIEISAAGQFLTDWNPRRNAPNNSLPTFSIVAYDKKSQGNVIQENVGTR